MRIRTFFALRLNDKVVRQLADCADGMCGHDRQLEVDWVDSDAYHLTLCFLGDTTLEQVDQLEDEAKRALSDEFSLQVHLDRIRYYQVNPELALIAALPSANEELVALQQHVADMVERVGINPDAGDFKPHITLGRMPADNRFEHPCCWPELDLFSLADSVVLFQSKRGEHGSVYTPLFEVELQDLA
ncbi:RNA 2',3'-cyclic phosphodiesterase [Neptunomonas marina]|uniref:RNA 2',3'-cyclic phosphodiesterase n=1 Tax=Neptunomonas marina TaxID=1815562 RepID=A0A437QC87_9GAMM|nr:RNA 2',3'-cyclic phosphodiesterase [Neptunomonas marina]RVU32154.1 RNA 2',3'-cyclic phosphodiesterase [Neptunomonas marina]